MRVRKEQKEALAKKRGRSVVEPCPEYKGRFLIIDAATGEPVEGVRYTVRRDNGPVTEGVTGDDGLTTEVKTETAEALQLETPHTEISIDEKGKETGRQTRKHRVAQGASTSDETLPPAAARLGAGPVRLALEVDGLPSGSLLSAQGGQATAAVVTTKLGGDLVQRKHVGVPAYEEIELTCYLGMGAAFYDWITGTLDHQQPRKSGAVVTADFHGHERSRLEFRDALLTEIHMPAADAAARDPASMKVKLAPDSVRTRHEPAKSGAPYVVDQAPRRLWMATDFRLVIDGLEDACRRVTRIEPLVFRQRLAGQAAGEQRDGKKVGTGIELPTLVLTLAERHAEPFYRWHESFVLRSESHYDQERTGVLEYLNRTRQWVLFTLVFSGLGIFKASAVRRAEAEGARDVQFEMYCEDIKLKVEDKAYG